MKEPKIIKLDITSNLHLIIIPPSHPRAINTERGQKTLLEMFAWAERGRKDAQSTN